MSTKNKCNIPAGKQALYDKLLAINPKIERKGAANPYTSLNGHMFTYLDPSGTLALRLPEKEREEFGGLPTQSDYRSYTSNSLKYNREPRAPDHFVAGAKPCKRSLLILSTRPALR